MHPNTLSELTTCLTCSLVSIEFVMLQSAGTSAFLCLILALFVTAYASRCQLIYVRTSSVRTKCPSSETRRDSFSETLKDDVHPLTFYLVNWSQLVRSITLLCLLIKITAVLVKLAFQDSLPSIITDGAGRIPWQRPESKIDMTSLLILSLSMATFFILYRISRKLFSYKWNRYVSTTLNSIVLILFVCASIVFLALMWKRFGKDSSAWFTVNKLHPSGCRGLILGAAASVFSYSQWMCQGTHESILVFGTVTCFVANAWFMIAICSLADAGHLPEILTPISFEIYKMTADDCSIRVMMGCLYVTILSLMAIQIAVYGHEMVAMVTASLGKRVEVRVDVVDRIVWLLSTLTSVSLLVLCDTYQILLLAISFALLLANLPIVALILSRVYACSFDVPQYDSVRQEDSVAKEPRQVDDDDGTDESETDIDGIVAEYKENLRIRQDVALKSSSSSSRTSSSSSLPSKRSSCVATVSTATLFLLSTILGISLTYVDGTVILYASLAAYLPSLVTLVTVIGKQPRNDVSLPALSSIPLLPLSCLSLTSFLLGYVVATVAVIVTVMFFVGLALYVATSCLRPDLSADVTQCDDSECKICLQPIPEVRTRARSSVSGNFDEEKNTGNEVTDVSNRLPSSLSAKNSSGRCVTKYDRH